MDDREQPGPGPAPEPGQTPEPDPARESAGGLPDPSLGPDPEWDAYVAWREREIAAGRGVEPPAPWELEGPAVSLSLGDAADVDPGLLAAICGPGGLGGDGLGPQFGQDAAADALRPGPVLAALTEQAAADSPRLTDDQLIGALHAARRLENRAHYLQTRAIAEFAARRAAELEAARARGVRAGCRAGEFPGVELASELLVSRVEAGRLIDAATSLTTRLPRSLAGMAAGLIDAERAAIIAAYTGCLSPEDAARADEVLAAAAPEVRAETLARRAAVLEMKLDPEAAARRKESARRGPAGRGQARAVGERLDRGPRARHRRRAGLQGQHPRHRAAAAPGRRRRQPRPPARRGLQRPAARPRPLRPPRPHPGGARRRPRRRRRRARRQPTTWRRRPARARGRRAAPRGPGRRLGPRRRPGRRYRRVRVPVPGRAQGPARARRRRDRQLAPFRRSRRRRRPWLRRRDRVGPGR